MYELLVGLGWVGLVGWMDGRLDGYQDGCMKGGCTDTMVAYSSCLLMSFSKLCFRFGVRVKVPTTYIPT